MGVFYALSIFLISLFWWPWADVPFEVPKVFLFGLFVKIFFLIFLVKTIKEKQTSEIKLNNNIAGALLVFVVWAAVASILGHDLGKSVNGNYYRNDGLYTLFNLSAFSFMTAYLWKDSFRIAVAGAYYLSVVILGIVGAVNYFLGNFGLGHAASFGNPVFLAGYLALALPFSIYFARSKNNKYLLPLTLPVFVIMVSGATSALLALFIISAIYAYKHLSGKKRKFVVIGFLSIFILVLGYWLYSYKKINSDVLIAEGRVRIFINMLQGVRESPLTGFGWANSDLAFQKGSWPIKLTDDVYVDKAHSHFLEILVTTGVVGISVYLALIIFTFKVLVLRFRKDNDAWGLALFTTFLVFIFHSQTNVISISEEILFWLIVGIMLKKGIDVKS